MVESARPTSRYRALLGNRNYTRVLAAGLGSTAGSSIATVCLVWIVAETTASALDVGLLAASWVLAAIVFSVFGGTLVDRYDRRRLMIGSDVARAGAMAFVTAELAWASFDLVALLAAYAVIGAFTTVFNPAEQALVPRLVPAAEVADANGLVRSSRSALQFTGAGLAGVFLVTIGPVAGLAVNAGTFALSALILTGLRVPRPEASTGEVSRPRARYLEDVASGFRWLGRAKGFLQLTVSATFFNFCSTVVSTFLVFFATVVLHGSALDFSLLLAAEVAGSGLGALAVGPTRAVRYAGLAWTVPYGAASGAVVLALALFPSLPLGLTAMFVLGALGGFAGTAWLTSAQVLVPTEMQGRYFGIDNLGSIAIVPAAQVGGAFLIAGLGVGTTYLVVAATWIVAGLAFLVPRPLRELGAREAPVAAGPVTPRSAADAAGRSGSPAGTRDG